MGERPAELYEFRPQNPGIYRVQQGRDLNAQLENNIRIQTLAANPLLLSLIVLLYERLYEQHERLPERRAELYKQCINMLLYEWDKKYKSIQRFSGLSVDNKRRMLEQVAWHFHGRHERYFPEEPLLTLIGRFLPGAGLRADQKEQVLEEISADTGLLKEQAEGWYGFLHLTFQEYFVARYVLDNGLLDELLKHRGEPWWEEVILLYAGSTFDIKPLLEKLLALEDDIFETNVLLAGRCLAANAGMDQEVAPLQTQIVTRLFEILEGTSYAANKKRAAAVLAELGRADEEINTRLLQMFTEKSSSYDEVKEDIATALGTYGERSLVTRLLPMLFDMNLQDDTRDLTASIIGDLGDTSIVATLLPKLQDKSIDASIRENIVLILGRVGDNSLSSQLLPLLLDEKEDQGVRISIASLWSRIGNLKDTPQLSAALFNSQISAQNLDLILIALNGLQNDRTIVTSLVKFASDTQGIAAINSFFVAAALGKLRNPTVTGEMVQLVADRRVDLSVRKSLVASLRDATHSAAIPELQRIYADVNTEQKLKEEIAKTLYVLGDRTIPVDPDKILKDARGIGTFEQYILEQMDVSEQLQLLEDTRINVQIRRYIVSMLANSTDTSIVPPLCKLATDRIVNVDVRKSVIETLGKIADDRATVEALVELANDDRQVREEAVEALWYVSRRARVRVVADELTRRVTMEK